MVCAKWFPSRLMHMRFVSAGFALFSLIATIHSQNFITYIAAPQQMGVSSSGMATARLQISGSFQPGSNFQSINLSTSTNSWMSGELDFRDSISSRVILRRITADINETFDVSRTFSGTTISGTIRFDSTIDFLDTREIELSTTLTEDNMINTMILRPFDFVHVYPITPQTSIGGSYELSGPTQTATGTFDVNLEWQRSPSFVRIDRTDSPGRITITGNPTWWLTAVDDNVHPEIISETIDGVDIEVNLDSFAGVFTPNNFIFIPEPSTYASAIAMMLIAFIAFRRVRLSSFFC